MTVTPVPPVPPAFKWTPAQRRALYADVQAFFRRYVVFREDVEDAQAVFSTLWVFHTWCWFRDGVEDAEGTPYALIEAPTSEAGKSRWMDVAKMITARPMKVIDPSPASLFRSIDGQRPTLFVDETDMLNKSPALRGVLNAGYEPGNTVPRAQKVKDLWVIVHHDVFCPKAFAGITTKKPPLEGPTLSRCVRIQLQRKAKWESVERFTRRKAMKEAEPTIVGLDAFAAAYCEKLADAEPAIPAELTDRQEDVWRHLFAIADLIGTKVGKAARQAAVTLAKDGQTWPDLAVQVLSDVRTALMGYKGDRIHSATLFDGVRSLDEPA
jgi:Protein of unknown function (DUF3631)